MNKTTSQKASIQIKRYTLLVMTICYLPHFFIIPWWLLTLIIAATVYKILSDYQGYSTLNRWLKLCLVVFCLIVLRIQYQNVVTSEFFIGFLLTFIALKTLEIQNIRDIRVLILCNLYLILSALILVQELWIIIYMLIAVLANLSLMLKLNAPQASLFLIGKKSSLLLATAIPLTMILFYVFPRLANPLWQVPALAQNQTGFGEHMNPGEISQLINDDSIAMRVTFNNQPILNGYWKGIILSLYNGKSWTPSWYNPAKFTALPELVSAQPPDYEVILEPGINQWLFYLGYPGFSHPSLLFSQTHGLQSPNKESLNRRYFYAIKMIAPPYQPLSDKEYQQYTQLPRQHNPQLIAWSKENFTRQQKNIHQFINFLHAYILEQPFWYTLSPPLLHSDKNPMDEFWFTTQKGFCEHYASAVAVILRAAGIPARIILGYQGGRWNPVAQYLNIQQNNAHAWIEYWQEGSGWHLLDPTSFISLQRVDPKILELLAEQVRQNALIQSMTLSWLLRLRLFLDSAQFFAERWLLFYNQDAQQELLQRTGLGPLNTGELIKASVGFIIAFIILIGLCYEWIQKRKEDPLLVQYHLLQDQFKRFQVQISPSSTLKQQCTQLILHAPELSPLISSFLNAYERLRLQKVSTTGKDPKKSVIWLMKSLRKRLQE